MHKDKRKSPCFTCTVCYHIIQLYLNIHISLSTGGSPSQVIYRFSKEHYEHQFLSKETDEAKRDVEDAANHTLRYVMVNSVATPPNC